ncbi:MAG: four helix bundle protein [Patescibacteria group bacterium]|nr:four helix bundle protein [Patescibacteria group bacterium]
MNKITNSKPNNYDLEERTFEFAKDCRELVKELPKTIANFEDGKQLVRSSGSVAANYIEANESLSKKDFVMRIKICRKEAKESKLWLRLLGVRSDLMAEALELQRIFGAILEKCK